jgi:hypothetical protein
LRLTCRVRGRMGGGFRIVVGVVVVVRHGPGSMILPHSMQRRPLGSRGLPALGARGEKERHAVVGGWRSGTPLRHSPGA